METEQIGKKPVKMNKMEEEETPNEDEEEVDTCPGKKTDDELETLKERIAVDLANLNPVTRKKIAKMHNCQTLSFADSEEDSLAKRLQQDHDGDSSKSGETLKPCLIKDTSDPLPHEDSSEQLPRSVSFNDHMLDQNKQHKMTPLEARIHAAELHKPKTPSVLRLTYSVDAACGSQDTGRKSIKSIMTSNFARKLSFKSTKEKKLQHHYPKELQSEMVNGLPSPETAGIVSYEALLRLFQCPGCNNTMAPPFAQCKKGHLVCTRCKTSTKATCPSCKQRITENSNYMMEKVYCCLALSHKKEI